MKIIPFSSTLIASGVEAHKKEIAANDKTLAFHKALVAHGVDLANVKEYRSEFLRMSMEFRESKMSGFKQWWIDAKDLKGTAVSPFKNSNGVVLDKRALDGLLRGFVNSRIETYERYLAREARGANGSSKKSAPRSLQDNDVRAFHPRLVAYRKLETPTQKQMDRLKALQEFISDSCKSCKNALATFNKLEAKNVKNTK